MDITPPQDPPSLGVREPVAIDLAKERELRALRAQVAQLTERVEKYSKRLTPNLSTKERHEEEHGYKCGYHLQVDVSMETASVVCRVCGTELAPLDVLREFARGERQFVQNLNHLREEKQKLAQEVDQLKKQRSSLRSQVKKKGGKVEPDSNNTAIFRRPPKEMIADLRHEKRKLQERVWELEFELRKRDAHDQADQQADARDVGADDAAAAGGGGDQGSHPG